MERGLPADHTTLDAALRTRTEPEMPAGIETNQRLLEGRRNLHLPGWELPVSCRRFHWRHDRLLVFRRARRGCGQSVLPESLAGSWSSRPRVITVDGNPSYPKVIEELKQERKLGRRCCCRTCPYLNNVVEQDHRGIKRRVNASQGFRSFDGAWRTIQGYEVLHMIRKGQVRWLRKGDVLGHSVHPGNSRIEKLSHRCRTLVGFGRPDRFCNTTGENPANNVFVDEDVKSQGHLLRNARTAPSGLRCFICMSRY
jgi:hypothetical protein